MVESVDEAGEASAGLTDELSRRLNIKDTHAAQSSGEAQSDLPRLQPRLLCEERHEAGEVADKSLEHGVVSKWRQKEKLKTTAVALVLCLNIGVDPPDVIKISPCARLECWVDPMSMQPAKALETIGKNLQAQYERWQPRAKYKMHLDPTVEDVKKLCVSCRRNAKNERVLFHYNGHGVPRPTVNGELWVFNSRYTQYIPLSIYELQAWLGTPCIYVLDCSAAGVIINSFRTFMEQRQQELRLSAGGANAMGAGGAADPGDPMKEVIVLAACGAGELLPQNPELPADVFTACLTTPIKVSLRWFCSRSLLRHDGITKELIDRIPGRQTDRKTPLGELNWIFTAITDTIAWNVLPRALFQKLFRSDLLVASLFRNFLLAERIMVAANCTPISYPRLPPTHQHPMWQAWDMAAEMCLMQLPSILNDPTAEFQPSSFFSEQLTAFELWLAHGSKDKRPPEQLPIVLQVLLSQVHRLRALVLLGRFLDMGPWAVDLALSVGIFPYVLKLLQTTSVDLRSTLVFIWCKILALDKSCQVDLVDLYSRAQASFVLSAVCNAHPKGQALCANSNLLTVLLKWLRSMFPPQFPFATPGHALLLKWLCLCLGKLCQDMPEVSLMAIREGAADLLVQLLTVASPDIRAAAVFGLGCLVHSCSESSSDPAASADMPINMTPTEDRLPAEQLIANAVRQVVYDPSVLVRCELAVLYARFVRGHSTQVQDALKQQQHKLSTFVRNSAGFIPSANGPSGKPYPTSADVSMNSADGEATTSSGGATSSPFEEVPVMQSNGQHSSQQSNAQQQQSGNSPQQQQQGQGQQGVGSDTKQAAAQASSSTPAGAGANGATPVENGATGANATSPASRMSSTYSALLESIQMLALDPSPKVAKLGRDVLRIAQYELNFVGGFGAVADGGPSSSSNGSSSPMSNSRGASFGLRSRTWKGIIHPRPTSASVANSASHAVGSAPGSAFSPPLIGSPSSPFRQQEHEFSRHLYLLRSMQAQPAQSIQAAGARVQPPPLPVEIHASPFRQQEHEFSRHLYLLRSMQGPNDEMPSFNMDFSRLSDSTGMGAANGGMGTSYSSQPPLASSPIGQIPGSTPSMATPQATVTPSSSPGPPSFSEPLPPSLIYKCSSDYFSRPMLEPMASAWRETEGLAVTPWTALPDSNRRSQRLHEIEAGVARCKAMTVPKLRDQVFSVETGCGSMTALCFHPYYPIVCIADSKGFMRITNYNDTSCINAFHATNGAPLQDHRVLPTHVTFLRQLNEASGPVLLCGSSDGAVRVWRSYTMPGSQRMATALQAVTIHLPPAHGHPTAFEWSSQRAHLFAAALTGAGPAPSVERIVLGQVDPNLLLASCSDSTLRVFDVRNARSPAAVMQPFKQSCAGVVFEPAGRTGVVVAALKQSCAGVVFEPVRRTGVAVAVAGG
eukprot:gene20688-27484_t